VSFPWMGYIESSTCSPMQHRLPKEAGVLMNTPLRIGYVCADFPVFRNVRGARNFRARTARTSRS